MLTRRWLVGLVAATPAAAWAKPTKRRKRRRKDKRMATKGVLRMDRGSYDELPAPEADMIGQEIFVEADTNTPGFRAVARINDAGTNEWYEERDTFQQPLSNITGTTFTNLVGPSAGGGNAVADLADYTEMQFTTRVTAAGTTGRFKLMYQDAAGGTLTDLGTNYIDLSSTGTKTTAWEPIPAGARTGPVLMSGRAYNGDGTEDPAIFLVVAFFRR